VDVSDRIRALQEEAEKQIQSENLPAAEITLERIAGITEYLDEKIVKRLVGVYQTRDDVPSIQRIWKRAAVSCLEHGALDRFLNYCYLSAYSEQMFSRNPSYRYSTVDQDINAFINMAARTHPLRGWVDGHKKSPDRNNVGVKRNVGFLLEGFSRVQAPIRNYFPLFEHYDRSKLDLFIYSRIALEDAVAKREGYAESVDFFLSNGCKVKAPHRTLSPMAQVEYLTQNIVQDEIDILVFQTTYWVPQYNFISCLRPAFFQTAVEHQQPEFSKHMDLVFATRKGSLDSVSRTAGFPMVQSRESSEPPHSREEFGIPEDAVLLVSANREVRYAKKPFWKEIAQVMERHPNVYFIPLGLSDTDGLLPSGSVVRDRIRTLGFRTDVIRFMKMSDIYVDYFPSGGGSSLIEAMQVGLPIISFDTNYATPFSVDGENVASLFVPKTELLIPFGDMARWHEYMDRLITDRAYRLRMGQELGKGAELYKPEVVAKTFFADLEQAFSDKLEATAR
jgi:predicted O-linked N-acetylglucosamine transferase (SPINDLY family)